MAKDTEATDTRFKLLKQGAESKIYATSHIIAKHRIVKHWRLLSLDTTLRSHRTSRESKTLVKLASTSLKVPKVMLVTGDTIYMEFVTGETVKDYLNCLDPVVGPAEISRIGSEIGKDLQIMHQVDIIHGYCTHQN